MLGYILIENEFKCCYCYKFKFGNKWYKKGTYLHPENILNVCNQCKHKYKD
jgi:hypothetical protein